MLKLDIDLIFEKKLDEFSNKLSTAYFQYASGVIQSLFNQISDVFSILNDTCKSSTDWFHKKKEELIQSSSDIIDKHLEFS